MLRILSAAIVLSLALVGSAGAATDVTARHRSGQTFVTWTERPDAERYLVYRASRALDAEELAGLDPIYEVPRGSANFYFGRYNVGRGLEHRYAPRYVIEDGGAPLGEGTGLLVWTLAPMTGGMMSPPVDATASTGPVSEAVEAPRPVRLPVDIGPGGRVYLQYMNLRRWNPTFDARRVEVSALQYAYDYVVYAPRADLCGGEVPAGPLPVALDLHGHGGGNYAAFTADPAGFWCIWHIYPLDGNETWYFGFARDHDYRAGGQPGPDDVIVNYTEQRVLRMLYDLERDPETFPPIDRDRRYVLGHSMGGTGTLALALRYPDVFAAAYASEPMTDFRTSGDGNGTDWRVELVPKWGAIDDDLGVVIDGPAGWTHRIRAHEGTGVWHWQNHQHNLVERRGDDAVPFGIGHGYRDSVIEWTTQGRLVYPALEASRQYWGGAVTADSHRWLGFRGLPPAIATDRSSSPFAGWRARRRETVPGFGGSTDHTVALPPEPPRTVNLPDDAPADLWPDVGGYHQAVTWSSSWEPWDGPPVDTATEWAISLGTTDGVPVSVDVTPRRSQRFCLIDGADYEWQADGLADGAPIAAGRVALDDYGLLTVPGVMVEATGTRLTITREGRAHASPPRIEISAAKATAWPSPDAPARVRIAVQNTGPEPAPRIELAAILDDAFFVDAQPQRGHCEGVGRNVRCTLPALEPGEVVDVIIVARADAPLFGVRAEAVLLDCDGGESMVGAEAAIDTGPVPPRPDAALPPPPIPVDAGVEPDGDAPPPPADARVSDDASPDDASPEPDAGPDAGPVQSDAEGAVEDDAIAPALLPIDGGIPGVPVAPMEREAADEGCGCDLTGRSAPPVALLLWLLPLAISRRWVRRVESRRSRRSR